MTTKVSLSKTGLTLQPFLSWKGVSKEKLCQDFVHPYLYLLKYCIANSVVCKSKKSSDRTATRFTLYRIFWMDFLLMQRCKMQDALYNLQMVLYWSHLLVL
jgi:hypothetical protein